MNNFTKTISLATILVVVFGACHSAAAQAIKTEYRGLETPVKPVSPGTQWVTADRVLHIRNLQTLFHDDTSDARVSGDVLITMNADFKLAPPPVLGYGPANGQIQIQNAGGTWVGTWVGTRTVEGHSISRAVMKGTKAYQGLQARVTYVKQSPDPTQPFLIRGVIIETP